MGAAINIADQWSPPSIVTAASAPAAPATMKLGPLQSRSSRHTLQSDRCVDRAIAPAISVLLTRKYVTIVPAIALGSAAVNRSSAVPPRAVYAWPVERIVIASAAILKTVRYSG